MIRLFCCLLLLAAVPRPGAAQDAFTADFDDLHDRTWIGPDFWAVPLEDWRVADGRLEYVGRRTEGRVNVLTRMLGPDGALDVSVRAGLAGDGTGDAAAGLRLGIRDRTDDDVRSLSYFGDGLDVGVHADGTLFAGEVRAALPPGFDLGAFTLRVKAWPGGGGFVLAVTATDAAGRSQAAVTTTETLRGLVALVHRQPADGADGEGARSWFDDLRLSGTMVEAHDEQAFGPVLWSMYTLSRGVLKMTAQMPPLGDADAQHVELQLEGDGGWTTAARERIDPAARTALFRITGWDASRDRRYRLVYREARRDGTTRDFHYEGTVRRDPVDRPLVVGGLTCQHGGGFPYRPLVENLAQDDPDLLYFSGDQIYESNGGYGITRYPADAAIVNYLGKYYMFGWAFGDLMRDRPTVVIPDDHDVYQGNLWGSGGDNIPPEEWAEMVGAGGGYVEPARMVDVVHRTQCAHLPDPYDATPIKQDISVYYTHLVYGRVSFAIVSDRMFKTGPAEVAFWEGRHDHLRDEGVDPARLDRPDLVLLGDRQEAFLADWVRDWRGADMKAVLSETVFANVATHHGGEKMYLWGDLDSGGWPKAERDDAVALMRQAFAYHISGDQHLPSLVQYGVDGFRDAGWQFCTPAISVGYERRFQPDRMGRPVAGRPAHGLPNTGRYVDAFGNPSYVYAVGNPEDETADPDRYVRAQRRASGYGLVRFDQAARTITAEAYRFMAEGGHPGEPPLFPGWPLTVHQQDNDGRERTAWLPTLRADVDDPVVEVRDDATGETLYVLRIEGRAFRPGVFGPGTYTVRVWDPETGRMQTLEGLEAAADAPADALDVRLGP